MPRPERKIKITSPKFSHPILSKEQLKIIESELKEFLQGGIYTRMTELLWLQSKNAVKIHGNGEYGIIITNYEKFQDMLNQLNDWHRKIGYAKMMQGEFFAKMYTPEFINKIKIT